MHKKRILSLLCLLALTPALAGCGMQSRHAAAIRQAVAEYSDCYIELHELERQLRKSARSLTGYEQEAAYTLDVRVPDYSLIDVNSVGYEAPAVDFANPDSEAYLAALSDALRLGMQAYVQANPSGEYVDAQIELSLIKSEGGWHVEITESSRRSLQALIDGMMEDKLRQLDPMPKSYDYLRVAEQCASLLGQLVDCRPFAEAAAVTSVDDFGGGEYRLSFDYPDPEAVFERLSEEFIGSFHARVFGAVDCRLDPGRFPFGHVETGVKSGSVRVRMDEAGRCSVTDGEDFASDYFDAKEHFEAVSAVAVEAAWGVPLQPYPASSAVLAGSSGGSAEIRMRITETGVDTYLRIYRIEDSLEEEGEFVVGQFVLADARGVTIDLPGGQYKMLLACGYDWYGPEYMFGPEGSYYIFEEVIDLPSGYYISYIGEDAWYNYGDVTRMDYDVDISR
ncbi:MAG: hypothetical protein Q4C13_08150 [Clostridia bacterium]|nr:hypothetical protein [Clostridia bacterium]